MNPARALRGLTGAFAFILALTGVPQRAVAEPPGRAGAAPASSPADEWARNNPPSHVEAQANPVPNDNAQPEVSPEEREAIGLPAPVWVTEGKVHSAVTRALEEQRKLIQEQPDMAWVQPDRPAGFEGTAYVDVYLRHQKRAEFDSAENQAAIQEAQRRLMSGLTAAEFALVFAFKKTAGLVGYVNEAGLAKLSSDPRIVAIGIDDQPRPEDPPRAIREPTEPNDPDRWTLEKGKIDPQVNAALRKSADGYVFVDVGVTHAPLGGVTWEDWTRRKAAERAIEDRVLATMSSVEMRVHTRGGGFSGYVNAAGLAKLEKHPDVVGVGLVGGPVQFFDASERRPHDK